MILETFRLEAAVMIQTNNMKPILNLLRYKRYETILPGSVRTLSGFHGFRNPGARLGDSSVFLQSGTKISELPLVVRKVNNIFELYKR